MSKVYDFQKRLEERREVERKNKETQGSIDFFLKYFGDEPREVLNSIWKALNSGDIEEYKKITEPILYRKLLKEYNQVH